MEETLVIIQRIGLLDSKEQFKFVRQAMKLPNQKISPSTVAILHQVEKDHIGKIAEYDSLIYAQPKEIGLKLIDGKLIASPFSNHPYGMDKSIEVKIGETIRFEWKRLIGTRRILTHFIINIAYIMRPLRLDIFMCTPTHHILTELT